MRLTVEVLDALLQDGRAVVAPSVEEQAAITHLEAEGFIRLTREPVFRCFDPADDACADHPTRACLAWVPAPLDEDRVLCPACGLDHEDRSPATSRLHLHVDAGRAVEWIDQRLRQIDPDARRRREGVAWSLATAELDAVVVWLDGSLDTRLVTRAFASSQPVVFVATRSRPWVGRFRDDGWLAPLGLADWLIGGDNALLAALSRAAAGALCAHDPAMRAWTATHELPARTVVRTLGSHRLVLDDHGVSLDSIQVLAAEASAQRAILRVLIDRWREDLAAGKAPADHCTWSPDELAADIEALGWGLSPKADTIRRQLSRLRAAIRDRYREATGVALDDEAVVELIGGGARLNPAITAAVAGATAI